MESGLDSGFWGWLQNLDFGIMGFILVGLFILVWVVSMLCWKIFNFEEKKNSIIKE